MRSSSEDERTSFLAYAITNPGNITKVETAIREEIEKLLAEGVTPEELDAAKKGYIERQTVDRSDDKQLAALLGETAHLGRDMSFIADQEQKVRDLTVEAVSNALKKWLNPQKIVVVVAGDFAKGKTQEKPMPQPSTTSTPAGGDFKVTESGLKYKIMTPGDGKQPMATNVVVCHYKGWLDDGTEFDSSYKRNEPAEFPLNRVIPGWTEGLQLIKEGGKIELEIPPKLGYGARGIPGVIPGGATLHFTVELIEIKK